MYLDKEKLLRASARARRQMIWGIVLTAFFGLATYWGLVDHEGLRDGLDVYLLCLIPSLLLLGLGLFRRGRLGSAQAYSTALSASGKSEMLVTELSASVGKTSAAVSKELRWLIAKGYVVDCSFAVDGVEKIVLNAAPAVQSRNAAPAFAFVTVECPNCGASNSLRRGSTGRCEYCGGQIVGK